MSFQKNKEKLKRIPHILAGSVILLHAYAKYEEGQSSSIFFFIAGLIFLCIAIFHHKLAHRFPLVDIIFFSIEALLSFTVAYEYFKHGKSWLPFAYIFAGLMQFVGIYMFIVRKKRQV